MIEQINELYQELLIFTKSNPVFSGVMGLWGLSVLTFMLKTLPSKILAFFRRQCTTTLVINSYDDCYRTVLKWLAQHNMHSFVRNLNLHTYRNKPIVTIGYGRTYFWYGWRPMCFDRTKEEASQTVEVKETLTITMLGRNKEIFQKLSEEASKKEDMDLLKIHRWYHGYWRLSGEQVKRPLDTIILSHNNLEQIEKHLQQFFDDKEWYARHGIPYRTGILLYGPPGTGKTSLIKSLSAKYDRDLFTIDLNNISDQGLQDALAEIPKHSIVAIEDIDTVGLDNRGPKIIEETDKPTENKQSKKFELLSLGGVLNAIDGISTAEGYIVIATTNDITKLDPALIREGRFDLKLKLDYMDNDMMRRYLKNFYPDYDCTGWNIKKHITQAQTQKLVIDNRDNPERVLEMIAERVENG